MIEIKIKEPFITSINNYVSYGNNCILVGKRGSGKTFILQSLYEIIAPLNSYFYTNKTTEHIINHIDTYKKIVNTIIIDNFSDYDNITTLINYTYNHQFKLYIALNSNSINDLSYNGRINLINMVDNVIGIDNINNYIFGTVIKSKNNNIENFYFGKVNI